jgi:hypothetical protein
MRRCQCCGTETYQTEDDRCKVCSEIARLALAQIGADNLAYPELPYRIEGGQIPTDPAPTDPNASCAACGQRFSGLSEQWGFRSLGREFFVHERCWKVILTL